MLIFAILGEIWLPKTMISIATVSGRIRVSRGQSSSPHHDKLRSMVDGKRGRIVSQPCIGRHEHEQWRPGPCLDGPFGMPHNKCGVIAFGFPVDFKIKPSGVHTRFCVRRNVETPTDVPSCVVKFIGRQSQPVTFFQSLRESQQIAQFLEDQRKGPDF